MKFTFVDLFAGVGGFRIAMETLGGECVFSSEWDKNAQKTYEANFGEIPEGDITKINVSIIPSHDILCAGFPCQAFSMIGKRGGFNDTRGALFHDLVRIIDARRPKSFMLENVKGLMSHAQGKTISIILDILRNSLNYYVPDPEVLNARDFGLPQHRERVFIVGFRMDQYNGNFSFPQGEGCERTVKDVMEELPVSTKYYLSTQYLNTLRAHKERHRQKGNGFGFEVLHPDAIANALVAGGMGRERNLVKDHRISDYTPVSNIRGVVNRENIRRMTPREWARLQGFPDDFVIPVADYHAYRQFGNSVPIPVVRAIGNKILDYLPDDIK